MIIEVKLPQFGMGMQDATVLSWYCKEGDHISMDAPLLEIESAKTTVEVPSPATGILKRILVQPGENVPVLAVLAEIDDGAAAQSEMQALEDADLQASAVQATIATASQPRATPLAASIARVHEVALETVPGTGYGGRVNADDVRGVLAKQAPGAVTEDRRQVEPRARKLALDQGLALESVSGTGPGGRVVEDDVRAALAAAREARHALKAAAVPTPVKPIASEPAARMAPNATAAPRSAMREVIATRMMQSLQGSAQLTLTSEVDVTALVRLRDYLKREFDVSYTGLFVKACALALQRHPQLNASWSAQGVLRHAEVHIGVAVAVEDGLLVPVIRDVQAKGLRQVASEFVQIVELARSGGAGSAQLTGSTFSISNLGNWGIDAFTPVLNPPEAGILGLGRIQERLVRDGDGDGMAWRKVMVLSLTFDHRVLDGVPAAQFLQTLAKIVAQPEVLLV